MACAERTQISLTAFTPVQVLKTTGKAGKQPDERVEDVMRQDPGRGETDKGRCHLFERRKQAGRKDAEMRREFPGERDHQEREGRSRNDVPAAFAASGRCPGKDDVRRRSEE